MLFIHIALTVLAWSRGWKGYALLPVAIGYVGSFLVGYYIGYSGGYIDESDPIWLLVDLAIAGSLIGMAVKSRKQCQLQEPDPDRGVAVTDVSQQ